MAIRKFIVTKEIIFYQKRYSDFGQKIEKMEIKIPIGTSLKVDEVKNMGINLRFKTGYKIFTTFERLQELINSESINELEQKQSTKCNVPWCWHLHDA